MNRESFPNNRNDAEKELQRLLGKQNENIVSLTEQIRDIINRVKGTSNTPTSETRIDDESSGI